MGAALIILGALVLVGGVLYILHRRDPDRDAPVLPVEEVCCGQHQVCEKTSLLASAQEKPEYFDDEELDNFRGRHADEYTDDETEQFRDVLLTLRPEDVAPWARSIQLRGITLPTNVREELLLIVSESRAATT